MLSVSQTVENLKNLNTQKNGKLKQFFTPGVFGVFANQS